MAADHLIGIEQFEANLWKVADNLRANSNLASNELFIPILGLIFLRHATNRYYAAMSELKKTRPRARCRTALGRNLFHTAPRSDASAETTVSAEIEAHDWSLTPGRYVGVALKEGDEGFDFQGTLRSIHFDLQELNEEATKLAARNIEESGV